MKYWEDFYNEVSPYVENCPLPVIKHQIVNAAIEFCQRTALWRKDLDPINISINEAEYSLASELTTDEAISAINFARVNDDGNYSPLAVVTDDVMQASIPNWKTNIGQTPNAVLLTDTENARIYPIPERAITGGLLVSVILKPSRSSAAIQDWIYEQWAEVIAHGAKARLLNMKSRPWYAPDAAVVELTEFESGIKDATIRTNKGNSRRNTSVHMRPLA